ncbi:molybdate ABC transporter substrate-binding protein, partial [Alkalibaculum bacchi]|uniref:molybdate ABC transporter substrate-binding protein n=1 Tax=Alkalibaculum bacchi TaxID=645887 RepID=UPI0026EB0A1C
MKKRSIILTLLLVLTLFFAGCNSTDTGNDANNETNKKTAAEESTEKGVTINISAAASLSEALTEIQTEYEKETKDTLQFNFAGSGSLQKQIQEGAPCDLFVSASKAHMDTLEGAGFIDPESRKDILGNTLTLIASKENADVIKGTNSLTSADVESISIGEPETVPAGKYAQQSFESLGFADEIKDKIILAKDVKQVLEYVETGNVDCGLVYKSDAILLETGKIVADIPEDSHDPIVYPAALIKDGEQLEAAADFYEFLQTDYAKGVFEKYGFVIL